MSSSKEVVHKRRCLKRLSINDIISRGGPKDDYYINNSRTKRPKGGSEGIKTIFETTLFMDGPLCIARRKAVAAAAWLHERRRLRNLRFLGCGQGGLLSKYSIAYYKLRLYVCTMYVCAQYTQYKAERSQQGYMRVRLSSENPKQARTLQSVAAALLLKPPCKSAARRRSAATRAAAAAKSHRLQAEELRTPPSRLNKHGHASLVTTMSPSSLLHDMSKRLLCKGQLISKGLLGFFNSPKKRTKNFCPNRLGQKFEFSSSFYGGIGDTKKTFRN